MPEQILLTGLAFGESPRWHEDRLWFANWGTPEIVAVGLDGTSEVVAKVPASIPCSIDWLPDGPLLVVSGPQAQVLRTEEDGSLKVHADLRDLGDVFNEIVVDSLGNAYVNGGSDPMAGGASGSGIIALVRPDGSVRQVADDIAFGNGMAITADGSTLIVAESWGNRLTAFDIAGDGSLSGRRVWVGLGGGFPDGICLDAEGAAWYADVPGQCCVRVREGGEVLQSIELDRGCFACMLGGADRQTLFMLAAGWRGFEHMTGPDRTGQVLITPAPAPGAGRP
jgi:sugar lactone lactonase YvrE